MLVATVRPLHVAEKQERPRADRFGLLKRPTSNARLVATRVTPDEVCHAIVGRLLRAERDVRRRERAWVSAGATDRCKNGHRSGANLAGEHGDLLQCGRLR